MAHQQEIYDLLLVTDATASMTVYLASLRTSLPQIISISSLTDCFSRIGVIAYRDYDSTGDLLEWSGWLDQEQDADQGQQQPDLVSMVKSLTAHVNGDTAEASKTALAKAYQVMRPEATTIILLFTDAPPHTTYGPPLAASKNTQREQKALSDPNAYGGFGPYFADWVTAGKRMQVAEKKMIVFSLLDRHLQERKGGHYEYLSTLTGGACLYLNTSNPMDISKVTVEVLLTWMGAHKAGLAEAGGHAGLPAQLFKFTESDWVMELKDEADGMIFRFGADHFRDNLTRIDATPEVLKMHLPKKTTPISDFAAAWKSDPAYRPKVLEQLKKIIEDDVRVIAFNPVFGGLWRAVCADKRTFDEALLGRFASQVDKIADPDDKARMREWLEESYNFIAEIQETINSVPESNRFPCVCLDPTLNFTTSTTNLNEDEGNKQITDLTRLELQEIGRSCEFKILRLLGRILTQLSYFESEADMPAHIAAADSSEVPRIPMALASNKHNNQFWRVLLHVIRPGTMLSARAGALLAALSLRLGVEPLTQVAEYEMLRFRDKWNNCDIPENWSLGCLSLLMDADNAYRQRHGITTSESPSLLNGTDRALFERLVSFKLLELNLKHPLNVTLGWKPEKTAVAQGPVIVCQSCQYPRSVTIMGPGGKCGFCASTDFKSAEDIKFRIEHGVSKTDNESTPVTWVECCVQFCRAQYVVYNPHHLKIRPKCYYCRVECDSGEKQPAPYVECTKCLNRIIWPEEYRPASFSPPTYLCPACTSGHKTIVDIETTAWDISAENTFAWLITDTEHPNGDPFTNRSLHHTVSTIGPYQFLSRIHLFPPLQTQLTLSCKTIQNATALLQIIQNRIANRKTETLQCSLCFSFSRPSNIFPACGRHGCHQRICNTCLAGWYGLNAAGRIINTAALSCPFCRRKPSPRTLYKYGMGIHAVGNLSLAVQDSGEWIYAWCLGCGFAKQYMERVCARGAPDEVVDWRCEDCHVPPANGPENAREAGKNAIKPCPGCGTMTEKTMGCDHIQCTACGAHWCYFCGGAFPETEIYRHMDEAHGGWYGGRGLEFDSDDDMDDVGDVDTEYGGEVD